MFTKKVIFLIVLLAMFFIALLLYNYPAKLKTKYLGNLELPDSLVAEYENHVRSVGVSPIEYMSSLSCITSIEKKKRCEQKIKQKLPQVDFSKNYLYTCRKKIKKITYYPFAKLTTAAEEALDYHRAYVEFEPEYHRGKTFLYLTDKVFVRDVTVRPYFYSVRKK